VALLRGDASPWARQTRRFKLSTTHIIAWQILDTHPSSLIGLEDLTGIRTRCRRRKRLAPISSKALKREPACLHVGVCRVAGNC
jgi:hypothetical protein